MASELGMAYDVSSPASPMVCSEENCEVEIGYEGMYYTIY